MIKYTDQISTPGQLRFIAVTTDVLNNLTSLSALTGYVPGEERPFVFARGKDISPKGKRVRDCSGILFTKGKKIQRKARPNFCWDQDLQGLGDLAGRGNAQKTLKFMVNKLMIKL